MTKVIILSVETYGKPGKSSPVL